MLARGPHVARTCSEASVRTVQDLDLSLCMQVKKELSGSKAAKHNYKSQQAATDETNIVEYAKELTDILVYETKPWFQAIAVSELVAPVLHGATHEDNPTD